MIVCRALRLLPLAVSCAATLAAATTGVLIDREGRAVEGAAIVALPFETEAALAARLASGTRPPEPLASARSDAAGRFSLDADADYFRIIVDAPGHVPLSEHAERDENIGALLLERAEQVEVAVRGEGKPIEGATILMVAHERRTDGAGKATLRVSANRATVLRIFHPDWAPLWRSFESAKRIPRTLDMNRGATVRGTVIALSGAPAPGVAISVDDLRFATSDADGAFSLPSVSRDWRRIVATRGEDIAVATRTSAENHRLRLAPGAAIHGTVTDGKTPIEGALVHLTDDFAGASTFRGAGAARAIADAKGRFRIGPLVPGTYSLSAARLGVSFPFGTIELRGGERVERNLAGQLLARVSGTVVDEERNPVAAATVRLKPESPGYSRSRTAPGMPAWSSREGAFVLREVPVDREATLEALRAGMPRAESETLRLRSGERKGRVVLVMPRGLSVTGSVSDRSGAPIRNATVQAGKVDLTAQSGAVVVTEIGGLPEASDAVTTGADGTFAMRLAKGVYDLTADADGYAPETARAIDLDKPLEPVAFELGASAAIVGRVVRRDGSGVPDVSIDAMASGSSHAATTGPDGAFVLDELRPGSYMLLALGPSEYIRETKTVEAPANDVVIAVPPAGTVRGRVLEKSSKRPVTDFRVGPSGEKQGAGMRIVTTTVLQPFRSDDGAFELANVPVGPNEIVAEAAGYVTAKVSVTLEEAKPADVTILLEPGARVYGRVTSSGWPVAGARVSLVTEGEAKLPAVAARSLNAMTDASGEYALNGIPQGERAFRVSHESHPLLVKRIEVSGRETQLDLELERGLPASGSVIREGGDPISGAQVSAVTAAQAGSKTTTTDAAGAFRIEGLAPGRYTFRARAPGVNASVEDVDIATSGPIRIVAEQGATVTGRVIGLIASELADVAISVGSGGTAVNGRVKSDGTFRIDGAPAGSIQVSAFAGGTALSAERVARTNVEVTAGAEAYVELDFSGGYRIAGKVTRRGAPVDSANVTFRSLDPSAQLPGASANSNTRGEYAVEGLRHGVYGVYVVDTRTMSSHETKHTVRGDETLDIAMSASTVRVHVIDRETQEGIGGASITLEPVVAEGARRALPVQTDASGNLVMEGVSAGAYRVRATRAGYGQEIVDVSVGSDSDETVEVKVSRTAGVEIRVVDKRDGRALRGFVSVADAGGLALEESVDGTSGRLSLAPGAYRAAVSSMGYATSVVDIRSPGGPYVVGITPGGTLRIDSASGAVRRGRLLDGSGRPVPYVRITAPPEFTIAPSGTTMPLEPGSYAIEVLDAAGSVTSRQTFAIAEGQTTTIRI